MKDDIKLKYKLIVTSFLPLAMLMLIKHFDLYFCNLLIQLIKSIFTDGNIDIHLLIECEWNFDSFITLFCFIVIVLSLVFHYSFKAAQLSGFDESDEVENLVCSKEEGLLFFVTYILPLLTEVSDIRDFIVLIALILIICNLMSKTNLFFQNPILTILKYRIYRFDIFEKGKKEECIGITYGELNPDKVFKYKRIADNVFLIYNVDRKK